MNSYFLYADPSPTRAHHLTRAITQRLLSPTRTRHQKFASNSTPPQRPQSHNEDARPYFCGAPGILPPAPALNEIDTPSMGKET